MNPTIARLALEWLRAERRASSDFAKMVAEDARAYGRSDADIEKILDDAAGAPATADEMAVATDRVYHVLRGEVRWSECSPGDKAIWKGRMRDAEKFERAWTALQEERTVNEAPDREPVVRNERPRYQNMMNYPTAQGRQAPVYQGDDNYGVPNQTSPRTRGGGPRLHGYRERHWWNYYDTAQVKNGKLVDHRLFNNRNVGNLWLSNLEVPGQLRRGGFDSTFVVIALCVSVPDMDVLRWASDNMLFTLCIGDRPSTPATFVRDLFIGVVLRRALVVPVRQNVSVVIDMKKPPVELGDFDVTFHIDGLETHDVT